MLEHYFRIPAYYKEVRCLEIDNWILMIFEIPLFFNFSISDNLCVILAYLSFVLSKAVNFYEISGYSLLYPCTYPTFLTNNACHEGFHHSFIIVLFLLQFSSSVNFIFTFLQIPITKQYFFHKYNNTNLVLKTKCNFSFPG